MPTTISRGPRQQTQGQTNVTFCDNCGNPVEGEAGIHVDEQHFCSSDCASANDYVRCDQCGLHYDALSEEAVRLADTQFCSSTCAEQAGAARCPQCGELFLTNDTRHVVVYRDGSHDDRTLFCSEECANAAHVYTCECCGIRFLNLTRHTPTGRVCASCAFDDCDYCDECGRYFTLDHDWNDDEGCCSQCASEDRGDRFLHSYGFCPPIDFYGDTSGGKIPYLGVELETDITGERDSESLRTRQSYCHALHHLECNGRFWMTQDSSLACGVEVTSMPMTLDEHINSGLWDGVRAKAIEHGFSSHDNGRCGLHIHINRDYFGKSEARQNAGGYNLAMLVSRFEKQLTQFSRRRNNNWCEYGIHKEYISKTNSAIQNMSMFQKSSRMCEETRHEHSQCVNFQHSATFELRIFRGTLRLSTLYASLAMTQGLACAAKHHSQVWCENIDWYTLMNDIATNTENVVAKTAFIEYLAERGVA